MTQKIFAIGDIHGHFEALKKVLKKSKFDYNSNKLIVLGDIIDGGLDTFKVVEELLKIKHLVFVLGNHDEMFKRYLSSDLVENAWLDQGGWATLNSYGGNCVFDTSRGIITTFDTTDVIVPMKHQKFFDNGKYYYVINNMLFIHGGLNLKIKNISLQDKYVLINDRKLINYAQHGNNIFDYKKVFVGHTSTQKYDKNVPIKYKNLLMLDTGIYHKGKLTLMNVKTEEFWQSEK